MTSMMALFWALEPSAESLPAGQARPEALALLPGSAPPGCSFALVGSEPHAARLRVARAASAASWVARQLTRRFMVMRVLHRRGVIPLGEPGGTAHGGLGSGGRVRRPPDVAKVRASRVLICL